MKKNKANFEKLLNQLQKLNFSPFNQEEIAEILRLYYPRMQKISFLDFADRIFSDLVKIKKSDSKGVCSCITCGAKAGRNDKRMHNGHFKSRSYRKRRFSLENCRPQCQTCNVIKNGNYGEYMLAMQRELGAEKAEAIRRDQELKKRYDYDLCLLILTCHREIKDELKKRGLQN